MIEYKEVRERGQTNEGYERVIWDDGEIWHLLDGWLHREDGPAIIKCDGTEIWYTHDRLHREDGPAVIYTDGIIEYWLDDILVIPDRHYLYSPLQLAKLGLI